MNKWECEHPGCNRSCIGTGSAIGLRAIGWYFIPGWRNNLFCPGHHPSGYDNADREAREVQTMLYDKFEIEKP